MSAQTGWKILREDVVYENPWISVHDHDVIAPTGHKGIYGKVHFKALAMGVFPIDQNGYTYIVGQDRFCFGTYSWELPEGGGDPTLPQQESAARELAEETSMAAREYIPLFENAQFSNSVTDEVGTGYLAYDLYPCEAKADDTEKIEVRHIPVRELYDMMDQGEVTDLFTIAMLLAAHRLAYKGKIPDYVAEAILTP